MTLAYGYAKAKILAVSDPRPSRHGDEIQYHLHASVRVGGATWDIAINVGTNDADDLLKYKLVYDFRHPITTTLRADAAATRDLTGTNAPPALDFLRSDLLAETGKWRDSDVMDGSGATEPAASLTRLLKTAAKQDYDVYLFGRFYKEGDGLHDVHMNQGSRSRFIHRPNDDSNDHNDVWQDGGLLVDMRSDLWAAYVAAFEQQCVPTDELGNPVTDAKPIA